MTSKLDQLRALREARLERGASPREGLKAAGDKPALSQTEKRPTRPVSPSFIQKRGRGRPKIIAKRPWEAEGISRRTWYRRKAEQQGKSK